MSSGPDEPLDEDDDDDDEEEEEEQSESGESTGMRWNGAASTGFCGVFGAMGVGSVV